MSCSDVFQTVPGEDGNNVSSSPNSLTGGPQYKYDFVLNNYTESEVFQIKDNIQKYCKKAIIGFEIGEQGTHHLQGYISLKKKERITGITKWPGFSRCSLRKCRNENALKDYCMKDGNFWTFGITIKKPIKYITPNKNWQLKILDIIKQEPNDRTVYWFWSEQGKIGKSTFCKYLVGNHNAIFIDEGKKPDIMHIMAEANMDESNLVVFDIPRDNGNNVSYKSIESIKNGMIFSPKYKSSYKLFNSPHLIVFANKEPLYEKLSEDRWIVENIDII
nr:MAG: replication associated protein [Cressdnaviricota sp.]